MINDMDGLDPEGYASFESELSEDGRSFVLKIDSTVPMDWNEVLLALASWLADEAQNLTEE